MPPINKLPKNERRFVLGEKDAAKQEALAHGGGYIEINPIALKTLEEGQIDPFLIYEQALRKQMEDKVDRFDFVKMDVDVVFKEWSGKPSEQASMPVRLVLWMKENAASHGYQQSGNSWVLKK